MSAKKQPPAEPAELDLGHLALFVGQRVNELVFHALERAGHSGLTTAHGYVFQHLLSGPWTITELAGLMGVSQQMASKSVAQLVALGYVEDAPSTDARARSVRLSAEGHGALRTTRAFRARLERRIRSRHGTEASRARTLLAQVLSELGGAEAVRTRRIRAPR